MTDKPTRCVDVFLECCAAIERATLIHRVSRSDKEFHFQNWVRDRLGDTGLNHDSGGRNSYPDFTLVDYPEGYEIKGLGWPGREANYDSNSRVPTGLHNGRTIFYVFGRYPSDAADDEYPVIDLIICHGDFLNANHDYVHENKSFRGFGSYGDLLVRDRKMYVAPTPFALTKGTTGQRTLIIPEGVPVDDRLVPVGRLERVETDEMVVGYTFDLTTNQLTPNMAPNPTAGKKHSFVAYRPASNPGGSVEMASAGSVEHVLDEAEDAESDG